MVRCPRYEIVDRAGKKGAGGISECKSAIVVGKRWTEAVGEDRKGGDDNEMTFYTHDIKHYMKINDS